MVRDEYEEYEQDRLGNTNRKLDQLRAQEGMYGSDGDDEGIQEVGTTDTGTDLLVLSKPTHADQMILDLVHAHNSAASDGTFRILEAQLDGSGNITSTTRRSVPINVAAGSTRSLGYEGEPFTNAIAVNSEFAGEIGFAVLSDHKESSEPAIEQ
jgi:hypothetical protein